MDLYTASATAIGDGRDGSSRSSDGVLDVDLATPVEMGGRGGATNPEQLFAAGYAACFHNALKHVARLSRTKITDTAVTADVTLCKDDNGILDLRIELHVEIGGVDHGTAAALVESAHATCPYSRAIRGNVAVTIDVVTDS